MRLLEDIKEIFRKDWKLFVALNCIYFGAIILGALIAVAYPDAQMTMITAAGQTYGSEGVYASVGDAYTSGNVVMAAIVTFLVNFIPGTLLMIILPSLVLPFWALLFCTFRAMIWGVMLVVPVPDVLPLSSLAPHYLTLVLEGEAYIVAMFACTRGLIALLKPKAFGADSRLQAYKQSILDTGKLLLVVALILAVAATYEAIEVIAVASITGGASGTGQQGFYEKEFGANSSYSNWRQEVRASESGWVTFNLTAGKLARAQFSSNGSPIDVMVMDQDNFTAYDAGGSDWSTYVAEKSTVNATFDFTPAHDGTYWFVVKNEGNVTAKIHGQLRYQI